MTIRSRSGSIGGFVTCANDWRRYAVAARGRFARGRPAACRRPSTMSAPCRSRPSRARRCAAVRRRDRRAGAGAGRRPRRSGAATAAARARSASLGPRAVRASQAALEGDCRGTRAKASAFAAASSRTRRPVVSTTSSAPGSRRVRRTISDAGTSSSPASDATITRPSRRTSTVAGRRPLRSRTHPTRSPSPKTSAAGPSQGSTRAPVRVCQSSRPGRCSERRSGASRMSASKRRIERPAGRHQQLRGLVEGGGVGTLGIEQRPARRDFGMRGGGPGRRRPASRIVRASPRDCLGPC